MGVLFLHDQGASQGASHANEAPMSDVVPELSISRGFSMKKYKALLFALSVLACVTAAPAYVAALAGQDPVHERGAQKTHSNAQAASPLLDESVVRKMLDSGKASEANHINILAQLAGDW